MAWAMAQSQQAQRTPPSVVPGALRCGGAPPRPAEHQPLPEEMSEEEQMAWAMAQSQVQSQAQPPTPSAVPGAFHTVAHREPPQYAPPLVEI